MTTIGLLLAALVSAVVLLGHAAQPVHAHSPYFTDLQAITLPDGRPGQIGILHGDGVFMADPAWVVVIADGYAVARSHMSVPWALSCRSGESCRVLDADEGLALELDPASFRQNVPVPDPSDREKLWPLERGTETWGFQTRRATLAERVLARAGLAADFPGTILFLTLCGFVLCDLATERLVTSRRSKPLRFLFFAGQVGVRVLGTAFVVVVAAYALLLTGLSVRLWAASLLAGGALCLVRRFAAPAAAPGRTSRRDPGGRSSAR